MTAEPDDGGPDIGDIPDGRLHRVTSADQLADGDRLLVEIDGREIAVFNLDGSYHALLNYCVHQGGPVCEGRVTGTLTETDGRLAYVREDELVSCPWHGWLFDIKSGYQVARPDRYRLPTFDVVVGDGEVYVVL